MIVIVIVIVIVIIVIYEDRKRTNGVITNGVTANLMFFDRDILVLPLTYCYLPERARA